ncbi:MAG: hypothetical protein K0R21_389 [Anaerocolumna sp.]|jgi:uncharacterized membrane protein|nr:hypothetical protein [Anaerocolumna sp.]
MNKEVFLKELTFYLNKMKNADKDKFITFYDEMISDYIENGMSEEDAVNKIGAPKRIAEELLESHDSVKIDMPSTGSRVLNMMLLILGFPLWGSILLAGILLLVSFYILFWCIPFTTGVSCIGFFSTSIISIIGSPFIMSRSMSVGIMQLGTGIASIGISFLLGTATLKLSKKFIVITKKFNIKLVALFKKKVVVR